MEEETDCGTKNPVALFVLIESMLAVFLALYLLLWGYWIFPNSYPGNLAEVLRGIMSITGIIYFLIAPLVGLAFLWEIWIPSLRIGEASKVDAKVFWRFLFNMACWIVILVTSCLQNTGVGELPDTHYARAGFERLLKRPIPEHVRGIYFQRQNSILDEHEILRFNTKDEEFIAALIRDYELELEGSESVVDDKFKPGKPPFYTELHRSGPYSLSYNRKTGDAKFEWFSS